MDSSQSLPLNSQNGELDLEPRDLDAGRDPSSQRLETVPEESEYYIESPPVAPPSYVSARFSDFENRQFAKNRPPIGRRMFRAVARFFFAVLIGVGATLAWQSHGDEAKNLIRISAPAMGWLLSDSTPAAATLSDLAQQLKPMSLDIAIVRRGLEQLAANQFQLAAKQELVAQNVATLQGAEEDIRQEISSLPLSQIIVRVPRKPSPLAGQSLR
jgi:hypothetical protein